MFLLGFSQARCELISTLLCRECDLRRLHNDAAPQFNVVLCRECDLRQLHDDAAPRFAVVLYMPHSATLLHMIGIQALWVYCYAFSFHVCVQFSCTSCPTRFSR